MLKVKRCLLKIEKIVSFASTTNLSRGLLVVVLSLWGLDLAQAQRKALPTIKQVPTSAKTFTYDVSGSSGVTNGNSYSEINLGLNWYLTEWLNWRNAIFSRFGSNIKTINGLDSSILAGIQAFNDDRSLGFQAYVGPGVRVASDKNTAATADAGVVFTLAGLRLGVGAKALRYLENRIDKTGGSLPKDETLYYVVLAGGGGF